MSRNDRLVKSWNIGLPAAPVSLDEQDRIPFPSKKGGVPDAPSPRSLDPKPTKDRMMDRMRKVDPKQSERYRQRTGE